MTTICPAHDVLEKYRNGELSPAMEIEVSSHVEECGVCSLLMERLDAFDTAVTSSAQSSGERQLDRRMEQFLARQRPAPTRWRWEWALGYALALLLVYPAWLGLRTQATRPVASPVTVVELNVERGETTMPTIPPGRGDVVLSFGPLAKLGERLDTTITNGSGAVVAAGEIAGDDTALTYPRSLFPPGEYRLKVSTGSTGPLVFPFQSR